MHKTIIQANTPWWRIPFGELVEYRDLLRMMILRDLSTLYKQTILGPLWFFIQPFVMTVVFTIIFGKVARIATGGIPHFVFYMSGTVVWNYFQGVLNTSANCLLSNAGLYSKVYFPRLAIPISAILSGTIDFFIAFGVLLGLMVYFGITPTLNILWLPLFLLLALVTALGVGLWLSAMNVQYRDVKYTVPFLVQFWMFATPVAYPASLLSPQWRTIYGLNPMAGVVEGFRWALLGTNTAPGPMIAVSAVAAVLLLVSGAFYFRRMEKTFADVV
ncbi:MAG: ABC transporter permease [Gammaproteobacteria bacterium]|nr:ABC transporter permease [Gammaproteobacteria bacterium]